MSDEITFNYGLTGPATAPVILFLHGFMGSSEDWSEITERLGDRFRCLTVDLPGHGDTRINGPDELYRMEATASALIELLDSLRIEYCHLVGYSMGGRLALYLALYFSERFDRIMLESASPGLKTEQERAARRDHDRSLARKLAEVPYEQFLRDWYDQPLFASLRRHQRRLKEMIAARGRTDPAGYVRSLLQMGTGAMPSLWAKLDAAGETIGARLLLITGKEDSKFTNIATEIAGLVPGTRIATVAGCGHIVHLENPEEYVRLVGEFLTE